MQKNVSAVANQLTTATTTLSYTEVDTCPICKKQISPKYIAASIDTSEQATVLNFCKGCSNSFITTYKVVKSGRSSSTVHVYEAINTIASEPNRFTKHVFDANIVSISSQFDKIYNQALAAETYGLDEIAGIGYRKAMEFLVKDFASHENPAEAESIKTKPLAQCIKNYIDDVRIKTLAERSAWIGNDETHYVRKHEDRDIGDMKKFIQALVYFIGMVLITEDADSMTPQ